MGAYYTPPDVVEYVCKNTIITALFRDFTNFEIIQSNPDRYIYDAVKYGIKNDITDGMPPEVQAGLDPNQPDLWKIRKAWNTPTPPEYGLPTEIWRETIARRQRYIEIRQKIADGEITQIQDFITYNLNIRQFAADAIAYSDDPEFVLAFYEALRSISILDPTCGDGAFLVGALEILAPLYESCLVKFEEYAK